jgi:hypothetical protein
MLEIKVKVPMKLVGKLTSLFAKIAMILEEEVNIKEEGSEIGKIVSYKYNLLTGTLTIFINPEFVEDYLDLYGDILVTSIMFGKSMATLSSKTEKLAEKWFTTTDDSASERVRLVFCPSCKAPVNHDKYANCPNCGAFLDDTDYEDLEHEPMVEVDCAGCGMNKVSMTLEELEKECVPLCLTCRKA